MHIDQTEKSNVVSRCCGSKLSTIFYFGQPYSNHGHTSCVAVIILALNLLVIQRIIQFVTVVQFVVAPEYHKVEPLRG